MQVAFAITTIRLKKDYRGFPFDCRTVGLASTPENAMTLVSGNYGDIYEQGYYPWAVVEQIRLDMVYPMDRHPQWYKWEGTPDDGRYVKFDGKEVTEHPTLNSCTISNWSTIG